jgi:hypothetical protein
LGNLAKLWRYLILEPIENVSPALFRLRLAQILHERTNGRCDGPIQKLLSVLKPKAPLPVSRLTDERAMAASTDALRRRGWDILTWSLAPQEIASIRDFAFSTPAYATDPEQAQVEIREGRIPHEYGRYQWRISEFIRLPAVQKLIADSALHRIAQDYLGCRPMLTSVTLWLDPVYDGHFGGHVYHYDNDGPGFLKFFIYLSDVDVDTGAHTYIQGSHGHIKPGQFKLSTFYERDDLMRHYGAENEIVFAAPAGTILAEDTAGFHKGMDLKKGYRLLMQLQYAALDIPHAEEFSGNIPKSKIEGLDPAIKPIVQKFFT